MNKYLRLLRVEQWYKNFAVFLAIIFSGTLLLTDHIVTTLLAFLALCLVSSANYIMNDWRDAPKDRKHATKKHRPLAAQTISKPMAAIIFLACLAAGLYLAYTLAIMHIALGLFILTTLYTFWLKRVQFADILVIATNFVLRALAGVFALAVAVSPWLLIGVFFLALFLVLGKRYADPELYPREITKTLFPAFLAILILSYALYTFQSAHPALVYTLPLFLFLLLRYYGLVLSDSPVARNFERAFLDPALLFVGAAFLIVSVVIIL